MILEHFRLREAPFGLTPDTSFAYASRSHGEALDTLLVALDGGDGFVKITGEVGTGKTLLCRLLLLSLDTRYRTLFLPSPCIHRRGLLITLALELGLTFDMATPQSVLLPMLANALLANANKGRTVVACLDEAQAMSDETLETLRLLTNIETEKRRLLRVVLFGQPELDEKLAQRHMRQLAQRITFHYQLRGLTREETWAYLNHRMTAAGHVGVPVFGAAEAGLIHRATGGVPRLINVVAHKSLLLAYGCNDDRVRAAHVCGAADDSPATRPLAPLAALATHWRHLTRHRSVARTAVQAESEYGSVTRSAVARTAVQAESEYGLVTRSAVRAEPVEALVPTRAHPSASSARSERQAQGEREICERHGYLTAPLNLRGGAS